MILFNIVWLCIAVIATCLITMVIVFIVKVRIENKTKPNHKNMKE